MLGPDEEAGRFVRFRDSFVVRSADMKWRVRFHIIPSRFIEQPYGITFSNPMLEGDSVIELKHHADAPVVPFGPGGQSSRAIPHGHRLELRDDGGRPRVAVEVHGRVRVLWSSLKASGRLRAASAIFWGVKKRVFQADFQFPPRNPIAHRKTQDDPHNLPRAPRHWPTTRRDALDANSDIVCHLPER